MTLALRYAARSDRGLIRSNNEDSVYAGPRLLAVADGMGGHAAGEVASKIAIAALEPLDEDTTSGDLLAALRRATDDGSAHIRELVNDDPSLEGMGTTLTAILFAGTRLAICHIGDSRCYLMRDGELAQITHDDTFVQTLVDEGRITEEEAHVHPQRSLILRALNGSEIDPDLSIREAKAGDRYLICSDGLSDVVSRETMQEAMQAAAPQDAADRLVELALRGGGPDNITCIVADIIDDPRGETTVAPVVDGAAGDNVGQRDVSNKTAAGRAALAGPLPVTEQASERSAPPARRRNLGGPLLGLALVLVVLAGGVYALYRVSQNQWYVGADGERVAIFRGIDFSLAGLDLNDVQRRTDLQVQDLEQFWQGEVREGIQADDETVALRIVDDLRGKRLPTCPDPDGSTTTPSTTTASTTASTSGGTSPSDSPGSQPRPEPTANPSDTQANSAPPPTIPAMTSISRSSNPEPGVDCREDGD
ncbi:MAG: protein phosphatase 2C domain-containing protein [Actinomycetota bacterium]|nr:protein phosphatase 2C domain-containing protein [Actinomycetota bacterium]